MATISYAGATASSITVNIGYNGTSNASSWSVYLNGVLNKSQNVNPPSKSYSTQVTLTGLTAGTSYNISVHYFYNGTDLGYAASDYFSTLQPPVPGTPNPSVSVSGYAPNATVTATWGQVSGATGYVWSSSSGNSSTTSGTSVSFSASSSGTFYIYAYNSSGNSNTVSRSYTVSSPPIPSGTPTVYANAASNRTINYSFSASGVSGAAGYRAWLHDSNAGTDSYLREASPNTQYSASGLQEFHTYSVKIVPYNSYGDGNTGFQSVITLDETPPSSLTISGGNVTDSSVDISFSASDSMSGVAGYKFYIGVGLNLDFSSLALKETYPYAVSSGTHTISNLNQNTTYTVGVKVYDQNNNSLDKTISITTVRTVPSIPTVTTRIEGGFILSWGSVSGATSYQLDYKPSVNNNWNTVATAFPSTSLSGLAFGLQYDFRARAYVSGDWSGYSYTSQATVNPKTPAISGSFDGSTLSIYTAGLSGTTFDKIVIERLFSDGTLADTKSVTNSGDGVTWTSMNNSTIGNYKFRAYSTKGSLQSIGYSNILEFKRPQNFNWTGGDKVANSPFSLLASDWNALVARINEFRAYEGLGTLKFTLAASGNAITAAMFNELANAINSMDPPGGTVPLVQKGNNATAYLFNRLKNCLNTII